MFPSVHTTETHPLFPPQRLNYGKQRSSIAYGSDARVWLPNPDWVLIAHPTRFTWKTLVYLASAVIFTILVITLAVLTRDERNDNEPGPAFFNFLSHWLFIWSTVMFWLWSFCWCSSLARWLAFELVFFSWGSILLWAVMTTILLFTVTTRTIESLLPNIDDNAPIGLYAVVQFIMHFWPVIVMPMWINQYGEMAGVFWVKRLRWINAYLTVVVSWLLLLVEVFSPLILWGIYLAVFDPFDVYHITPYFASGYQIVCLIGLAALCFGQIALGAYLDSRVKWLISQRITEYDRTLYPQTQTFSASTPRTSRPTAATATTSATVVMPNPKRK